MLQVLRVMGTSISIETDLQIIYMRGKGYAEFQQLAKDANAGDPF